MRRPFWNGNTHYHRLVLAALAPGTSRVLDVGCGDGMLSADLARAGIPHVVAIDIDRGVLDRAQTRHEGVPIEWRRGDINQAQFDQGEFDAIVSVATLHHLDAAASLQRFAQLVRPGGVVVVVGLADVDWWDIPLEAIAIVSQRLLGVVYGFWKHSAPMVWPPPLTYREIKTLSATLLPGVKYRRHLLGRYSLVWQRPG
jgi:SAM-dependent methyltransferase